MTPAEQIEIWANAYYNGDPMVDDATYDAFCKKHGISSGLRGSELKATREPKFKHTLITGTLAKAEDLKDDEFRKWQNRVGNGFVNVSMKIDGCVSSDTKVITEQGEKTIKEVVENPDIKQVLSYNELADCNELRTITAKRTGFNDKKWYKVTTKSGKILKITEDDRLFLESGCYREVRNLSVGDKILALD